MPKTYSGVPVVEIEVIEHVMTRVCPHDKPADGFFEYGIVGLNTGLKYTAIAPYGGIK